MFEVSAILTSESSRVVELRNGFIAGWENRAEDPIFEDQLVFLPATLSFDGATSSATYTAPGSITELYVNWEAEVFPQGTFSQNETLFIEEPCTVVPTTTTTEPVTTTPGHAPTTAAPAVAAAAAPRFTG